MRHAAMLWGNSRLSTPQVQQIIDNHVTTINIGGQTLYTYAAWASDDQGTDFSLQWKPSSGLNYMAIVMSYTEIASPQASDFAGHWQPFVPFAKEMISAKIITLMSVDSYQSVCNCPFFIFLHNDETAVRPGSVYSESWDGSRGWHKIEEINAIAVEQEKHGFVAGDLVYIDSSGVWQKADANDITHAAVGRVMYAYTNDHGHFMDSPYEDVLIDVFLVVPGGFIADASIIPGTRYYLSTTSGQMVDEATALAYPEGKILQYMGTGIRKKGINVNYPAVNGLLMEIDRPVVIGSNDSAYVNIAYASDASGTDFTMTFDPLLDYIAILSSNSEIETPVVGDFAGLWKKYKGEPGTSGDPGANGLSAYEIAVLNGFVGTEVEWLASLVGADGDPGAPGQDGITPHIGVNGNWWLDTTDTGVSATGEDGATPEVGINGNWWIDGIDTGIPATGNDGQDGVDGREIELQTSATHIQWRYVGEASWNDLIALSALEGSDGINGTDGREVELSTDSGYVVWRYVGDLTWNNLFLIPADGAPGTPGDDGREVELRENVGWVEWRYVGDVSWTQLYEIPSGGSGLPSGGTTGQVLKKNSNTDYDVEWADDEAGGGGGDAEAPELHLDFDEAGDEFIYNVPYSMKFTSMACEGTDPTLSIALNTNMARYEKLTITATVAGLVSLYGEYVTI